MGRKGLRGRFSFWIGPIAISFLNESWLKRFYWGPTHPEDRASRGWALIFYGIRIQISGPQPWRS